MQARHPAGRANPSRVHLLSAPQRGLPVQDSVCLKKGEKDALVLLSAHLF